MDRKDEAIRLMYKETESHIKDIAFNRRWFEIFGNDLEEFDKKVNEWCEKYFDYFKDMDKTGMSRYLFEETMRMISDFGRSENDG